MTGASPERREAYRIRQLHQYLDEAATRRPGPGPWVERAACRDSDPELFFPVTGHETPAYARQVEQARQVCRRCPVLDECRTWALDHLPYGVAGGLTADGRAHYRRQRRDMDQLTGRST